jgi:hypothetical protein
VQETKAPIPATRVCSGGCPFFVARYDNGRKVAGLGQCMNNGSGLEVRVGAACAWKLTRYSRRAPLEDLVS